jgi:hypothetical protein
VDRQVAHTLECRSVVQRGQQEAQILRDWLLLGEHLEDRVLHQ